MFLTHKLQKKSQTVNNNNNMVNSELVTPIKTYKNAQLSKGIIYDENKNKSGVYRWTNNINGKTYVGSSKNLTRRFKQYFSEFELQRSNMSIYKALIKYGHEFFTLDILEYCSKEIVIEREQYYLDLLTPIYNILKTANVGVDFVRPDYTQKRVVSEETKKKLSEATTLYNPLDQETLERLKAKTIAREGVSVLVKNIQTEEIVEFTNQTEAGVFLGISRQAVYNAIKRGSIINNIYSVIKK